jgi:lipopolysaccharide transport system ATP-binding protein
MSDSTSLPLLSLSQVGLAFRQGGLGLRRRRFWVLRDVSFEIRAGETLGVIGRNAAGKSTLLRLLAGIIRHDRGTLINRAASISLLSLQAGFVPYLSGRQNAILGGMLLGLRRAEVEARMEAIIAFSELGAFIDQPLHTYSSGMRVRLGFSVAYQVDPDILLIDEVLGVGDEAFRAKSTRAMHDRIRSEKTVVVVSHAIETIRALCDRAIWIDEGVTRAVGETAAVLEQYHQDLAQRRQQPDQPIRSVSAEALSEARG